MAKERNKLICHFAGGCAISVSDKVVTKIAELGDGFADIVFNYIDTSNANISKISPRGDFWKIKTAQHGKHEIDGSGGERRQNAVDVLADTKEYLDSKKYNKINPNEFHLVMCSGSGGSGNVISIGIIDNLLKANIPTIAVVIGDSSNGLYGINTLNTLASLNSISIKNNKPLGIIYSNNYSSGYGNIKKGEEEVNKLIQSYITTLALFLSGNNENLDNQDMRGIIDQSNYKTIGINPGLYGIQFFSKEVKKIEGSAPTVGRTLTLPDDDTSVGVPLLHHKVGYVDDNDAIAMFKDQFPLHMVMFSNFFEAEEENLNKIADDAYNVANSIKSKDVQGTSKSKLDDETGLVL